MSGLMLLMQGQSASPSASTIFYVTLVVIFAAAIITAVATKWSRDKCLKFFNTYHVTLERTRGQTIWGRLKVFSSGIEFIYDHAYIDARGRKKTSFMIYQHELEQQVLSLLRYHDELTPQAQRARQKQVYRTFNPGPLRRLTRKIRNFVNTLRDAFNAAIGAAVGQYQRINPAGAILAAPAGQVTTMGQTLIGKFAGNAYEPLLEQYIGQPVILEVADPINPNHSMVEYTGYLADYTQQFVAILNVEHGTAAAATVSLPDVEQGDPLPPLPAPPAPGFPPVALPAAMKVEQGLAVRVDGLRLKIQNTRFEPVVVRRLEREGFEPVELGVVVPSNGTLDLLARDARGGKLVIEIVKCLDVVAPRKFALIRHAGQLVDRRGFIDEMRLNQLPLVPRLFGRNGAESRDEVVTQARGE